MREQIVAANWKQNGNKALCDQFIEAARSSGLAGTQLVICPPALWLERMAAGLSASSWLTGGQNCSSEPAGAFTGEQSAEMLKEAGADYCIVGHSERRALFGESNETVSAKLRRSLEAGLRPILCIGEALEVREAGNANEFVATQLRESLGGLGEQLLKTLVVAYEPVWAIGTGVTASPEQVQSMHMHIRQILLALSAGADVPILYGGSVKPSNAAELLALDDVDGALVGGASLQPQDFLAIAASAQPA